MNINNNNAERTLLILDYIALGVVGGLCISSNYCTRKDLYALYRKLKANTYARKYRILTSIRNLERSGVILLDKNEYTLSLKGKKIYKQLKTTYATIKKHKWDGVWRMVSYDIPSDQTNTRDQFRRKLKQWGFKIVHKSLWVLPWRCADEVAALSHLLRVEQYVVFMTTKNPPMENQLKKIFGLSNS